MINCVLNFEMIFFIIITSTAKLSFMLNNNVKMLNTYHQLSMKKTELNSKKEFLGHPAFCCLTA